MAQAEIIPLETTSSLDLKVTKEDLIDIVIDEQLTKLEKNLEEALQVSSELNKEIANIRTKRIDNFNKKLLKLAPKELSSLPTPKITCLYNHNSTQVNLVYEKFTVLINNVNTVLVVSKQETEKENELNDKLYKNNKIVSEIQNKINTLNGNNKRVKAQLLKTFLTKTPEGKAILSVLGEKPKTLIDLVAGKK